MSEFRFTRDRLRSVRSGAQKSKRMAEEVASNLEEIDHVPEESSAHYRGMAEAYDEIVNALDEMDKELRKFEESVQR